MTTILPAASSTSLVVNSVQPPTVTKVAVLGTGWASAFPFYNGYSIPVGSGAQLLPLPWSKRQPDQGDVFNENVTVNQSDLLLTGVNVSSYNVSGGTFSYNSTAFTATWTLPQSIGIDKLMLTLNADGSDPSGTPPAIIWTAIGRIPPAPPRPVAAIIRPATA